MKICIASSRWPVAGEPGPLAHGAEVVARGTPACRNPVLASGAGGSTRATAAFTMVEIAISIAIVAFALVAIIGVLPTGFDVQRQNRENTIINQEGNLWMEALRGGAWGMDYLTNHVDVINIPGIPVPGQQPPRAFGTTNGFRNGRDIVGLLTQPVAIDGRRIYERPVTAFVRAITGSAGEKSAKNDFAFTYRMTTELRPFTSIAPAQTNWTEPGITPYEQHVRSNLWIKSRAMQATTYELSLALEWPVYLMNNQTRIGNNRKLFRTLVSGSLASTNDHRLGVLHWLQPLGGHAFQP